MDVLAQLVDALRCLPGVGPRSARRIVYHLLQRQRQRGLHLAACLEAAMLQLRHCQRCNNYTETDVCTMCADKSRDNKTLCIVENPADVAAIEQSSVYKGQYFVLMGKISPLDGLGPEEIHLPRLQNLVNNENVNEIIIALSPTVEGQTTTHFIRQLFTGKQLKISQLAHGIPSGGELEFLDVHTIGSALRNRAMVHDEI